MHISTSARSKSVFGSKTAVEFPENHTKKSLSEFFQGNNQENYLYEKEIEFYLASGSKGYEDAKTSIQMLDRKVNRARATWACISAKSQRTHGRRYDNDFCYELKAWGDYVTVSPYYDRMTPVSAGRDEGSRVCTFTKRSRQRMLSKVCKINKEGLQMPFFVTVTYQKNMRDFKRAKKHLNAFFQRFRRIGSDFRYFWKMEPQERGAIHFHLAFFPPQGFFPAAWVDYQKEYKAADIYVEYVRNRVSAAWNEITKQNGYDEVTIQDEKEIVWNDDFFKRTKKGDHFGNIPLLVGTNVRSVQNWRMFTAYVGKYMKKEIGKNPWSTGKKYVKRYHIENKGGKKWVRCTKINRVRFARVDWWDLPLSSMKFQRFERESVELHTGRYWGFSNNFDLEKIHYGVYDSNELKHVKDVCDSLNEMNFREVTDHLISSAGRIKKEYSGNVLTYKLSRLRETYERQKMRYEVNKEKILKGYSLQFQLNHKRVGQMVGFSGIQKVNDCPLLMNFYGFK